MPMFTDYYLNKDTGRHELHFVNQQYDLLMMIYFDESTQAYKFSCNHSEAQEIAKNWGRNDFDVGYWLKEAEAQLKEQDKRLTEWNAQIDILVNSNDTKTSIKAAKIISKTANSSHVEQLYKLLKSENFFIRELIAEPLARIEGVKALSPFFLALQQGEAEGHDNDGLVNTLIGLLESNKKIVTPLLKQMLKSSEPRARADAVWGLGFVASQLDPLVFAEVIRNEKDAKVRSMAANALQAYLNFGRKYPVNTEKIRGRWMWLEPEENLHYGFEINETQGICTKNNAPTYKVGDAMLQIALTFEGIFVGKQIFTNGFWYPITGIVEGNKLFMQGGGLNWTMERV